MNTLFAMENISSHLVWMRQYVTGQQLTCSNSGKKKKKRKKRLVALAWLSELHSGDMISGMLYLTTGFSLPLRLQWYLWK
jgi:hypothetical protein